VVDTAIRLAASDYTRREIRVNKRTLDTYDPAYRSKQWLEHERRNDEFRARWQLRDASEAERPDAGS